MPELVASKEDVANNIETLRSYQRGTEAEKNFHYGLIERGMLFVVGKDGNKYAFAPSRFAGYRFNTLDNHNRRTNGDGRLTNAALTRLLGPPIDENTDLYKTIDAKFNGYCESNGITPYNIPNPRQYWDPLNLHDYFENKKTINPSYSGHSRDSVGGYSITF